MLSVREARSAAELERMHTGLGALPYAAEFGKSPDTEEVFSFSSCGGAMRSHDDDELTVHVDDASSDSSDETIELCEVQLLDTQDLQPWRLVLTMI